LGGSSRPRVLDDVDVVRTATVRGHLRFWWRALYAIQYPGAAKLYERESALWGRAATEAGGRSVVEIRIDVERVGDIDDGDIDLQRTLGAYALWPARAEKRQAEIVKPPAPRRKPGTQFRLTLIAPENYEFEVGNALRAWILFGGYGGRTRRGLGSLRVLDDATTWLPSKATRDALTGIFEFDIFSVPTVAPDDVPGLGGAAIHVGNGDRDAQKAWAIALGWLREFRQGTSGQPGHRAREPSSDPKRPSISNWPEADKIRHIKRKTGAHPPRHNATAAWPRAGFGLPINGQFQRTARNGGQYDEPGKFELRWRVGGTERDRLASPLIVKALPLADGTFVPCALWLNRAHPANGEVILKGTNSSQAPFDRLVAAGDRPRFSALTNKQSLRQAFLDWLQASYKTTVVAP
jgi:CRISPR-associated protein Cmr1